MKKYAAIISSTKDYYFFRKNYFSEGVTFYSSNYFTILLLSDEKITYLYEPSTNSETDLNITIHLGFNWHRDTSGKDLTYSNGFSAAQALNRRLIISFGNDYRNYKALKKCFSNFDKVYIPTHESRSLLRISKIFTDSVIYYATPYNETEKHFSTSSVERAVPFPFPNVPRLSSSARILQDLFFSLKTKNKIIHFSDWTSDKLAKCRSDTLIQNSLWPWKGFYFKFPNRFFLEADTIIPEYFNKNITTPERFQEILSIIGASLDYDLLSNFQTCIHEEYKKSRPFIVRAHSIYRELFENYKPNLISFPGETHFGYLVGMQVAKKMGIKTILIIDGYQSVGDKSTLYFDHTSQETLVDYFACTGQGHYDLLLSEGIKKEQCKIIYPTIISPLIKKNKIKKKYDAIILSYYPHIINPEARWDLSERIVLDIINVLVEMGFNNIAIKIKSDNKDPKYLRLDTIIRKQFDLRIPFLSGFLYDYLKNSRCFIGQISSSIIETFYHDIPHYIYEPYENGVTDSMIMSSKIITIDSIARTPEKLKELIQKKLGSIVASKDYIFTGPLLSEVDLTRGLLSGLTKSHHLIST